MSDSKISGDILLTGIGLVSPFGLGVEPFARALENGESAIKLNTRFPIKDWCQARLAATVPDFSLEELTGNSKESGRAAPLLRLAWAAMHSALEDAGLVLDDALRERTGIFIGSSRFLTDSLEFFLDKLFSGQLKDVLPIRIEGFHPHGPAVHLSYLYKIVGPTLTFAASCQSGIQALEAAMLYLARDHIDVAVVLSSDTLSPFEFHAEAAAGILSSVIDPGFAPRPYDRKADGTVLSEGAVALVLERSGDARARGAKIRAQIAEFETLVGPAPFPPLPGKHLNMDQATKRLFCRIDLTELDLIHADGRGIPAMDSAESRGIFKALGKAADMVPVTSIQGSTGHTGGTSALFRVVSTALILSSSTIPPIRNLEHPAEGCDLDYVMGKARRAKVEQAVVLSHGWGGYHSALLMRKE